MEICTRLNYLKYLIYVLYLDVDRSVLLVQTRQDRASFGTAGRAIVKTGNRVDGADASVGLDEEIAVVGQVRKGNVGELGEHALGLGSDLKETTFNTFEIITH